MVDHHMEVCYLTVCCVLQNIPRTGWVRRNVKQPETVAGHMYRMGVMAMLIPQSSGLDLNK